MATLKRQTALLFAGNADVTDLGDFGSAKGGTPTNPTAPSDPTDPTIEEQIQTAAYENGWTDAVVTTKNFPPIEEVNGVLRTISYQTCYLLQEGIPTWDANTEYSATSIVKSINGNELAFYLSLEDNNIGNQINDNTKWVKAIITGDREVGVPQITLDFTSSLPSNCIELKGQAVSRTDYNILFSIYGTTYGAGNGSTTFNLPNFTNRAIYGGTSAGYIEASIPSISASCAGAGGHSHSISSSGAHTHTTNEAGNHRHSSRGTSDEDDGGGRFTSGQANTDDAIYTDYAGKHTHSISSSGAHTHTTSSVANHSHTITLTPAVSGIYKNDATTVQPPSIKVRVYTRYK